MKRLIAALLLCTYPAFASRDGSGNYTLPAGNPVVTGTTITSTWANTTLADLATEMQDSLSRSGKGGMLSPFKFSDGTSGAPGATFTNEQTSGLYRAGAKDLRFSLLGNDTLKFTDTGIWFSTGGGTPVMWRIPTFFEIAMFFSNKMVNNQLLARLAFSAPVTILSGLPNAVAFASTAAALSTTLTLKKRTSGGVTTSIGTLVWNAAATNVSTITFSTDQTFAAGDFIEVVGPATADTTLADVTITIQARRQ
jgi:hypothetical protein